jgi:hypothetical protein
MEITKRYFYGGRTRSRSNRATLKLQLNTPGPYGIRIDLRDSGSKPVIEDKGATTQPNRAGWYKSSVTNEFSTSDALSGLADSSRASFQKSSGASEEGSAVTIASGEVVDEAGNVAQSTDSKPFKIDKTAPSLRVVGPTSQPNPAGWYNNDVTINFSVSDALSGLADQGQASFPKTIDSEGDAVTISSGDVADQAGNVARSKKAGSFKIDKSKPQANYSKSTEDTIGDWYKDSVTVSYDGSTDPDLADGSAGSGIAGYTAAQLFDTSGMHEYSGKAMDTAGNESLATTGRVQVDATAPWVTIKDCPSGLVARNRAVNISVFTTDTHSGLVSDPSGQVALDTRTAGTRTKTVTVKDKVDHSYTDTCSYEVNAAPTKPGAPTLSATSSSPNRGVFTLKWNASTDPNGNFDHYVLQHKDADDARFSNVASNLSDTSYSFGGSRSNQAEEDEGTWIYRVKAVDSFGEVSDASLESDTIKVD